MDKFRFSLLFGSVMVVILGTVVMYIIESEQPDSQIDSWIDAAWWAAATVTTVGYGDIVPVSDAGKVIAIFYMFFGVTVLGITLSVVATRYYKKKFDDAKEIKDGQKLILDKIESLEKNQEKLQKELADLIGKVKDDSKNNPQS